jgi:hypothetical protein
MKVATILPGHYLFKIWSEDYHMCLAHLIEEDDRYTEFYRGQCKYKDKYVIMDNGVIEGDPRPIEEIVKKALNLGVNEIILPDAYQDMSKTLDQSYAALRYVKDNFPLKLMAVPQGKTIEEWLECAEIMLEWEIDCLGIPKMLTSLGGRDARMAVLRTLGKKLRGMEIHLLGCWQTPLEITLIESAVKNEIICPVRGVDSAIPFVFAKAGILLDSDDRPQDTHITFKETLADVSSSLLDRNIGIWHEACIL